MPQRSERKDMVRDEQADAGTSTLPMAGAASVD